MEEIELPKVNLKECVWTRNLHALKAWAKLGLEPGRVIFFRTTFLFLTLKEDYKVHRIKLEHH